MNINNPTHRIFAYQVAEIFFREFEPDLLFDGICVTIDEIQNDWEIYDLPEVMALEPKGTGLYWFDLTRKGNLQRAKLLNKAWKAANKVK